MTTIKLSDKQKSIVDLNEGAYLVLASAGSGKTRVLTERIKRLSENEKGKILAITFTNKAAAEIKERLGNSIKDKNIFVGTFHSFCQSILELRFKLLGYNKMPHIFEDDADRIELIKQAINSVPYFKEKYEDKDTKERNQYTYNALQFISTVKRELISPEILIERTSSKEYLTLFETYQDILKSNNAIDFDDIIKLIYDLFINNEAVANLYRKAYSYICIDECQDLNKLQYYLLKSLCGETIKNIMMVGDPNQAIYGFNGSKASYMLENFVSDFNAKKFTLEENYRCSKSIIEASNKLMGLNSVASQYVIPGIFEINTSDSELDEANDVVTKINELTNSKTHNDIEGEIDYSKIAILARNKFVFKQIEEKLKTEKIPYYFKSGNSGVKFTSNEMKIFDYLFRIKINPLDKLHYQKLIQLLNIENIEDIENSKFPISTNIKSIIDEISIENIHLKLEEIKNVFNENIVNNDDEKKSAIEEIEEFINQLTEYKKHNLKPTLEGFKSAIALGLTNISNSKEIGICLSTVHTMKGQENEIVFLIGMDDGTFPDYRAIDKGGEDLQQEKNNTYVAFTRAKRFLFVSYPKTRIMPWGDIKHRELSRFIKPVLT